MPTTTPHLTLLSRDTGPATYYEGTGRPYGTYSVVKRDGNGLLISELAHRPRHSRNGFEWGNLDGGGASDCARSVLLDALGYDGIHTDIPAVIYRAWASEYLRHAGQQWTVTRDDIIAWYHRRVPPVRVPRQATA